MKTTLAAALFAWTLLLTTAAWAEDPYPIEWTQQIGTFKTDYGHSVAVDRSGNTYLTGSTYGNLGGVNKGSADAFLTKFDSEGLEVWTQQIGTGSYDNSYSVAVDGSGNAYITGSTIGVLGAASVGGYDAFLRKFDSDGLELWTQQFGTGNYDVSTSVAIDEAGNAYITGSTTGNLGGMNEGGSDAFLTKFDSEGLEVWSQQIGTDKDDSSNSVAVDDSGNAYITGTTAGGLGGASAVGFDAFLTKFDSEGLEVWTRQIDFTFYDYSLSVAVDGSGNAFITGRSNSGILWGVNEGLDDAFLTKFDSDGLELWTQPISTPSDDTGYSVVVDNSGNAYITGSTEDNLEGTNQGGNDAFLTKFDGDGLEVWTQQIGTAGGDVSSSVAIDGAGSVYISGTTQGSLGGASAAGSDAFLIKFGNPVPEPSTLLLGGLAVAGLLLTPRRRKK